ncbi:MAG: tRNA (N(6)-L-threonylcarbamoyladenosine(37)-C(2))-methylthiotransferase MtaB, partial [Paludibacteraceae bacterium]|nr:tRNA (N(6)-L-threonylcarbamoyladenosine(37)-C(2))-methylthiotransferase MtaB [Paludibacteraceae bacterium]
TCTVTDNADKKCRNAIKRIVRENPNAFLIVTGCYAQLASEKLANIPGVDLVLGANDKFIIPEKLKIKDTTPVVSQTKKMTPFYGCYSHEDRTRHFLKVQDGCDYFCSYCAIPFARGRSRNGSIEEIVCMAKNIAREGGKEIILTGVNIGDFGKSTGEKFIDLIKALDEVTGIERIRISSIEPDLLTDEIIEFVAKSQRFVPHFHIPLQCGSDEVLKLMRRHYDSKLFKDKVLKIKELMPDAFIGVDMIVGMRGETEELFEESKNFISSLPVSQLHVFPYSERAGTLALKIPYKVEESEKKRRMQIMLPLSEEKLKTFYTSQVGTKRKVLWESTNKNGIMCGFTENYVKVQCPFCAEKINQIEVITLEENMFNYEV